MQKRACARMYACVCVLLVCVLLVCVLLVCVRTCVAQSLHVLLPLLLVRSACSWLSVVVCVYVRGCVVFYVRACVCVCVCWHNLRALFYSQREHSVGHAVADRAEAPAPPSEGSRRKRGPTSCFLCCACGRRLGSEQAALPWPY